MRSRKQKDIFYLKKTFSLAKKAEGWTSPNPLVGAIIVKKNKIIAEGHHKKAGLPHAEIEAIKKAKQKNLKDSTLYVNLEPCSHFGRTPPCINEIIKNKFKKVVIATADPNPKTKGKSISQLKKMGIKVSSGLLGEDARRLNEVFFKNMQKNLPFVVVKAAQSLDGKIATVKGVSKWITDKATREFSKSLRDKYDCILTGVNTVVKDNPRLKGLKKVLVKVIIDPELKICLNSSLLKENPDKVIIFAAYKGELSLSVNRRFRKKWQSLVSGGAKVFFLNENKGWLSLRKVLKILYSLDIMSVFVEGGSQTIGRFFDEKLVDKVYFFIAPKIIGGKGALSSVGGRGCLLIKNVPYLKKIEFKQFKKDILISGYPQYGK